MDLKTLRVLIEVVLLGLLFILEVRFPLFRGREGLLRHGVRNIGMGLMNAGVTFLLFSGLIAFTMEAAQHSRVGLLHQLEGSPLIETGIAFILFDLWMYLWHRANHTIPFLWRFHRMHHSDKLLDVTSAFRFHIGELVFSTLIRFPVIFLLGLELWQLLLYETIMVPIVMIHHSNVNLPERWDRKMRTLLVTPNMHRVHHSRIPQETNSNYASVFSFWDRLGRSFKKREDILGLQYGLDAFDRDVWQSFGGMFKTPLASS